MPTHVVHADTLGERRKRAALVVAGARVQHCPARAVAIPPFLRWSHNAVQRVARRDAGRLDRFPPCQAAAPRWSRAAADLAMGQAVTRGAGGSDPAGVAAGMRSGGARAGTEDPS